MIIDLSEYKIRIIMMHDYNSRRPSPERPIDVPGTVLAIDVEDKWLEERYIDDFRLLEILCGEDEVTDDMHAYIRWDNDVKVWITAEENWALLSSDYPECSSIWTSFQMPILRDLRPAHERNPRTVAPAARNKRGLVNTYIEQLEKKQYINKKGMVYVEIPRPREVQPSEPINWAKVPSAASGNVDTSSTAFTTNVWATGTSTGRS